MRGATNLEQRGTSEMSRDHSKRLIMPEEPESSERRILLEGKRRRSLAVKGALAQGRAVYVAGRAAEREGEGQHSGAPQGAAVPSTPDERRGRSGRERERERETLRPSVTGAI